MGNNITPEHLVSVIQGATPTQIVILFLLGVIALGVIIGIVKWIIDLKLGTLPQELKEIQKSLNTLRENMASLNSKLWSPEDVEKAMEATIKTHIEHCPFHQKGR